MKILLVYPNLPLVTQLPNNIALLSAYLKHNGHDVRLFETTSYKLSNKTNDERRYERLQVRKTKSVVKLKTNYIEDYKKILEDYNPDLVGISIIDDTIDITNHIIENSGDFKIIVGGVSVILNPEKYIKYEKISYCCYGEGEETIVDICSFLENKIKIDRVPNLLYKDGNKLVYTKQSKVTNLDDILYEDYTIFDKERFYRPMHGKMVKSIPINFDRGCPYNCTYCCAPGMRTKYGKNYFRKKSIEHIIKEMKYIIKTYNPHFFYFNSESFLTYSLEDLTIFKELYKEINIPFWCQANISTITNDKIKILKDCGCASISIGLESGNEEFRKKMMKKYFKNSDVIESIKILKKYNIPTSVNNIIGVPEENRKLVFETIKINRQIYKLHGNTSFCGFSFQPYYGTKLYDYCIEHDYFDDTTKTTTPIGDPVINNPNMSREETIALLNTFVMYIKFPKIMYPLIRVGEHVKPVLNILKKIYRKYYE